MDPRPSRRLRATLTFVVEFDAAPDPATGTDDPVELARSCRQDFDREPFAYWSPAELSAGHSSDPTLRVEREVEVEPVPVEELAPEQVGMRLAPRRAQGWPASELASFLGKNVRFDTADGRQLTAKVASVGEWSAEVAMARAEHQLGPGPAVSIWVPALNRFVWANPESLTILGDLERPRVH
jgi:hypothetical protein